MQTIKRVAYVVALLVLFVAFDVIASLALIPYGSKSELVWADYYEQESVDTIVIGNSLAQQGVNPYVLDEALGVHCYNLSSPAQHIEESYVALKEVISQRSIKRVVYCVEFSLFKGESSAGPQKSFLFEKWRRDDVKVIAEDFADTVNIGNWISSTESITWLFPWVKNHVPYDLGKIVNNIKMRVNDTPLCVAAEINEDGWKYVGKGFGTYSQAGDFNAIHRYYGDELKNQKAYSNKLVMLGRMADLCKKNGVEFIVAVMPMPEFNLLSMRKNYESFSNSVKDCVVDHGGVYIDFNLATQDVLNNTNELYRDYLHLNDAGAETFSRSLAKVLDRLGDSGSIDSYFCSYEDRLLSIEGVQSVNLRASVVDGAVTLDARAYARPDAQVEYKFSVKPEGSDDWLPIQGYSRSHSCQFAPEVGGNYTFSVTAREAGSDNDYDCYCHRTVTLR